MSEVVEADVDAAFAEVAERRKSEAEFVAARKNLWRAHHWPHRYERCTTIGGRHVCRRCLWFYSVSLAVLAVNAMSLRLWPEAWEPGVLWLLALPATIEFIGGEFGAWRYDARRQILVTMVMGVAVGRGFHVELASPGHWVCWGPVLVYGSLWFTAAAIAWLMRRGQYREEGPAENG